MKEKVLCVIDIQKEYNTEGRPFFIKGIEDSLEKAQKVLDLARKQGWVVAHIQHLQSGTIFSPDSSHSDFIEEFAPSDGERVFTKGNFSCFSSKEFTDFLNAHKSSEIYIIGYGTTMCCISTVIDGYHRGYKITFVSDASDAKPTSNYSSEVLHSVTTEVIRTFATVTSTEEVCRC